MIYNQTSHIMIQGLPYSAKNSRKYLNADTGISNNPDAFVKKKGNRCPEQKLKPLNAAVVSGKNNKNISDKKPLNKLNSQNVASSVFTLNRRLPSKIPVLQYPKTEKINSAVWDVSLSAADRRQKFHQSRLYVAPPSSDTESKLKLQHIYYNDAELRDNTDITQESKACATSSGKVVLPPIKYVCPVMNGKENTPQTRKKCLRGEITHFPALCLFSKPVKKCNKSSVPHLPPIFTSPVAPPPSVSTSLEKDSNKVK